MSRDGKARTVFESSLELMAIIAIIIQERKLFKGGNYQLSGLFECDNYSREETIRGNTIIASHRFSIYCQVQTHISSDKAFFKIVKKPSIVQK